MKLKLEGYIELLDRMLERNGLAQAERDEMFNLQKNIDLISQSFAKRIHPNIVIKQLDFEPVNALYASLDENLNENTEKFTHSQDYAIKFLTSLGLKYKDNPIQLSRGTLEFYDPQTDIDWQISGSGYLRKKFNTKKIKS